jgi:RNA polymerase sigma-70 factor (ECF subfamily)
LIPAFVEPPTPRSLLQRLKKPPRQAPQAWQRFVQLYTPMLFAWTHRLRLGEADSADLVQEVFLLLFNKLPEFSSERYPRFRSWLWTVLLNKCREQQRRKARQPGQAEDVPLDRFADEDNVEAWTEGEYRRHLVSRALQLLQAEFPEQTWQMFQQYVMNERPAREVAAELGVPLNRVHLAKSRVLQRLREELDGLLD